MDIDPDEVMHNVAHASATVREFMAPVEEAAFGYRAQLMEKGWSPGAAEKIALRFHEYMLSLMNVGMK